MDEKKEEKKKESIDEILSDLNGLLNKMPGILEGIKLPEAAPAEPPAEHPAAAGEQTAPVPDPAPQNEDAFEKTLKLDPAELPPASSGGSVDRMVLQSLNECVFYPESQENPDAGPRQSEPLALPPEPGADVPDGGSPENDVFSEGNMPDPENKPSPEDGAREPSDEGTERPQPAEEGADAGAKTGAFESTRDFGIPDIDALMNLSQGVSPADAGGQGGEAAPSSQENIMITPIGDLEGTETGDAEQNKGPAGQDDPEITARRAAGAEPSVDQPQLSENTGAAGGNDIPSEAAAEAAAPEDDKTLVIPPLQAGEADVSDLSSLEPADIILGGGQQAGDGAAEGASQGTEQADPSGVPVLEPSDIVPDGPAQEGDPADGALPPAGQAEVPYGTTLEPADMIPIGEQPAASEGAPPPDAQQADELTLEPAAPIPGDAASADDEKTVVIPPPDAQSAPGLQLEPASPLAAGTGGDAAEPAEGTPVQAEPSAGSGELTLEPMQFGSGESEAAPGDGTEGPAVQPSPSGGDEDRTMVIPPSENAVADGDSTVIFDKTNAAAAPAEPRDLGTLSARTVPEGVKPEQVRSAAFLYASGEDSFCAEALAELDAICLKSSSSPMFVARAFVESCEAGTNGNVIMQKVADAKAAGLVCLGNIPQETVYELENVFTAAGVFFRHYTRENFDHSAALDLVMELILK